MTILTPETPDTIAVPFYQSQGWQQLLHKNQIQSIRFVLNGTGTIHTLIIIYPLPYNLGTQLYIPRGPVMTPQTTQEDITQWNTTIQSIAKTHRAHWCLIEPDQLTPNQNQWLTTKTTDFPKERLPHQTQKLDLTQSEEEILDQMHSKTRYNIRLAKKRGVTTHKTTSQDSDFLSVFDTFYTLLAQTSNRAHFHIHPKEHYLNLLSTKTEHFETYLISAKHQNTIISGHMFVDTPYETTYLHGGSDSTSKKYMGPHLIQWEAITQAKQKDIPSYDFWGTSDTKPSWKGITEFKRKFGGYTVEYPSTRAMIFNPLSGNLYKIYHKSKKNSAP